jgi:hypothetical protein
MSKVRDPAHDRRDDPGDLTASRSDGVRFHDSSVLPGDGCLFIAILA